eukprot:2350534-Pleurochrysis_carterae.AAC.1
MHNDQQMGLTCAAAPLSIAPLPVAQPSRADAAAGSHSAHASSSSNDDEVSGAIASAAHGGEGGEGGACSEIRQVG